MNNFQIYYENADTDDPPTFLATICADTMSQALELASQFNQIPSHDLVAVQVVPPRCEACGRVAMLSHGLCEGCTIEGMME